MTQQALEERVARLEKEWRRLELERRMEKRRGESVRDREIEKRREAVHNRAKMYDRILIAGFVIYLIALIIAFLVV